jgi:8-amino-7-oxononanoate synthase
MIKKIPPHQQDTLTKWNANHLKRTRYIVDQHDQTHAILNGKRVIHFCNNDYLCLSTHPDVKQAFLAGVNQYGLGAGASALVSGCLTPHARLEEAFADFLNREKALLFNSGYHANLAVITTFAKRNSVVLMDKMNHASLHDGVILSRANHHRFRHRDYFELEKLLEKSKHKDILLITESIFSIQGDIAELKKMSALAAQYHAMLIVDDAHGVGVLGKHGAGICEHDGLSQMNVHCLITPLGKGVGSMGAIVSGDKHTIDTLLQFARTYRYSTALPAAICLATQKALTILQNESWRRDRLAHLSQLFVTHASARKFILSSTDITPIKSIMIGSNQRALEIQKQLIQRGFFVSCIRPPTVPAHEACIRISLNCMHEEEHIIHLLDHLQELYANLETD